MLTRGMCVELARHNIQVNGIAPGYFNTAMTRTLVEDKAFTDWLCKRTPCRPLGRSAGAGRRCRLFIVKRVEFRQRPSAVR
ncbi:SDR family oxidoreductase [Klebsiella variicola subsp. variicola]|nr:SDR family oxidoreductase [Klebsiella variicola subsp. variicola]